MWLRLRSLHIRVSQIELQSTMRCLLSAKNRELLSGFLECFASELSSSQRTRLRRAMASRPREQSSPQSASPIDASLSQAERICFCYHRVLRTDSGDDRVELRTRIAALPSLEEVEKVLHKCVHKDDVMSQIEAKQFVLALLDAHRVEEARRLAIRLQQEYSVGEERTVNSRSQVRCSSKSLYQEESRSPVYCSVFVNKRLSLFVYTIQASTVKRSVGCTRSVPSCRSFPRESRRRMRCFESSGRSVPCTSSSPSPAYRSDPFPPSTRSTTQRDRSAAPPPPSARLRACWRPSFRRRCSRCSRARRPHRCCRSRARRAPIRWACCPSRCTACCACRRDTPCPCCSSAKAR